MATRQELMAAHDTCINTFRLNNGTLGAAWVLQDKSPGNGEPLIWRDPDDILPDRPWTAEEIRTEVSVRLNIIQNQHYKINEFFSKAPTALIDNGLTERMVNRLHLETDHQLADNFRITTGGLLAIAVDSKTDLSNIGANSEYTYNYWPETIVPVTPSAQYANSVNNALQVIAYVLNGICPKTGANLPQTVEYRRDFTKARLKVVAIKNPYIQSDYASDRTNFQAVYDYLLANIDDCTRENDCRVLGRYINNNVEKLHLIRRHWDL